MIVYRLVERIVFAIKTIAETSERLLRIRASGQYVLTQKYFGNTRDRIGSMIPIPLGLSDCSAQVAKQLVVVSPIRASLSGVQDGYNGGTVHDDGLSKWPDRRLI